VDKHTAKGKRPGQSLRQLKTRQAVLGGTDAAAILGLSRYRGPWDVFAEKAGLIKPDPTMTEDALWGLLLEPAILLEYQRRTDVTILPAKRLRRHPERRWQGGHVDGLGKDRVLEMKTRASDNGWGEPGTDEVPPDVKVQAEHYLAVTGKPRVDIAVLFRGSRMAIYTIWADQSILTDLTEEEAEWWHHHVILGEEPDFDGSAATTAALRALHPFDSGETLVALPHQYGLLKEFSKVRARLKFYQREEATFKQTIMAAMGDAGTLLAPNLRVRWTRPGPRQEVDFQRYAESLEGLVEGLVLGTVPITEDPLATRAALKSLYTTEKPGVPQLRVYESKESQLE
jgi:putative phage-type endonuclease